MTRTRLLVLGGLLITVLGLLASGLSGIQFRGGTRGSGPTQAPPAAPGAPLAFAAPDWILDAIVIAFFVLLGVQVVLAVVSRRERRRLVRQMVMIALTLVVLSLLTVHRSPLSLGLKEPTTGVAIPALPSLTEGESREESAPPRVPGWAVYLAAGVVGVGLSLWAVRRFLPRPSSPAEEIRAAASAAAADLAAGLPVADVVIRCWTRMVAVLSPRAKGADAPTVTPREFANRLVRLGFVEEPVLVLTKLFEEVRYGHKESEPRRAEAVAALAAIERAYG